MLTIDRSALIEYLVRLLETPSPSGHTDEAMAVVEEAFSRLGLKPRRTHKGALVYEMAGSSVEAPRAVVAHVDTLGAMVREIKPSGRLRLTQIGSYAWNTIEGESVTLFSSGGRRIRGSVLCTQASAHIYGGDSEDLKRSDETLEVRLDEIVASDAEARALGIEVGDLVAFDPRVEVSESGYVRGRHLDDKACVACLLAAAQAMRAGGIEPAQRTSIMISNYEEVGHGAVAGLPSDVVEVVTIDMAVVGPGQTSDERHVTVCVKDSAGPYDPTLSSRLRRLAEAAKLPLRVDTYPHYSSDSQSIRRTPADVRAALIGPGIDASHNYERTHIEALEATARLIAEYLRGA